jgi:hypothetical protein
MSVFRAGNYTAVYSFRVVGIVCTKSGLLLIE